MAMLAVRQATAFRRDARRLGRRGADLTKLENVVALLAAKKPLEPRRRDHPLSGGWKGFRDCHVEPDWVLIYRVEGNELQLARTGSHADLFE
jgi:mRNA interferase YafQ